MAMKVTCPSCGDVIPIEDVNVAADVAFCRGCGTATKLSTIAGAAPEPGAAVDPSNPPKGAWFRDDGVQITVGATTRSGLAIFLVPFTCVWSGFSMGGIYGSQIIKGKFDPTMSLFGIPFALGSVVLVSFCLMSIMGRLEVKVRGDDAEVFTGVGPLGWRRRFKCSEFQKVSEGDAGWTQNGRAMQAIILEGSRRLRFGSMISQERRYFMVNVLRAVLGKEA